MPTKTTKRRTKSIGRKMAPRSKSRSRVRSTKTKKSSRGGRSKRPTIAKVMKRVKSSRGGKRAGGMLKKATNYALNAAESALDTIL